MGILDEFPPEYWMLTINEGKVFKGEKKKNKHYAILFLKDIEKSAYPAVFEYFRQVCHEIRKHLNGKLVHSYEIKYEGENPIGIAFFSN